MSIQAISTYRHIATHYRTLTSLTMKNKNDFNSLTFLGNRFKRIQIIDYVLAYITMDIDGSASAKEFVGYFMITVLMDTLPSNLIT